MHKCLLAVQGPIQFVAGLIALEWHQRKVIRSKDTEIVLLLYDFACPASQEHWLADTIMLLSGVRRWEKVIRIDSVQMNDLTLQHYSKGVKELRGIIGSESFDSVYVMRDYFGYGSSLILNAYPGSRKITYGDSFGLVGNESEFALKWDKVARVVPNFKRIVKDLIYGYPKRFPFDCAVLTLPVDWSGEYLAKIPLIIPEKSEVKNTVSEVCQKLPALMAYCESLLETGRNNNLVLLSNLALSGVMSRDSEIMLYVDVVRQYVHPGETVILKAHPRAAQQIIDSVFEKLQKDYCVKKIDDAVLSMLPIEVWRPLIQKSAVIPIFSTSAVNIKYLYDKDLILPLDDGKVDKYFFNNRAPEIKKTCRFIAESIKNLDTWDMRTPLWRGL